MMKMIFMLLSLNLLIFLYKNYFLMILIMNYLLLLIILFFNNNFFFNYYWSKINYIFGMDTISFSLCLLSLWIIYLSMYTNNLKNNFKNFLILMIFLLITMVMLFCSMNIMIFYVFFEISLIPMILIIMGWGYQIDRIQASMYMLFYTLLGSLPLLIMILFMYNYFNFIMMNNLWLKNLNNINNLFFFLMMNLAFLIKMPMYMLHLWLPKAHVEAPVSGSMILAGIMLKLGSYGMYRFFLIFPNLMNKFNLYMIMINLFGSLIMSLVCMNQNDMKVIIAYSSIVHMSILLASMFTLYKMSFKGSLLMMLSHGLCSSSMFYLANLNYERLKSRNLLVNKNLINIFPSLTLWWFLICSSNFSAPPSLNLFSEIFLLSSLIQWNNYLMMILMLISFFSTSYTIFLYSYTQYGKMNFSLFNLKYINCKEFFVVNLHWLPLNMLFLNMNLFI